MFEYMAAGLPVVATDIRLWEDILRETKSGITVDIRNIKSIEIEIENLLNDTKKLELMAKSGRKAVENKYNWKKEERKLLVLYGRLLNV